MRRPFWAVILLFVFGYKLGIGMAAVMATPLYISLGFSLDQIAAVSKFVGFFSTVLGALFGGMVTVRFGILRSLMLCGILQLAGNLFYVLQSLEGNRVDYLALCVTAEKFTGCDGIRRADRLSFQFVLAGIYRNSIRAAIFARVARPQRGGIFERSASREARLGALLPAHHGSNGPRTVAARLDRTPEGYTIQRAVTFGCFNQRLSDRGVAREGRGCQRGFGPDKANRFRAGAGGLPPTAQTRTMPRREDDGTAREPGVRNKKNKRASAFERELVRVRTTVEFMKKLPG